MPSSETPIRPVLLSPVIQDKLLYGSDCNDSFGKTEACSGSVQIAQVRAFSPSKQVERKLLYENARTLFRF